MLVVLQLRSRQASALGRLVLLVLLLAPAIRGEDTQKRLAVLEFDVAPGLKIDRVVFSDLARGAVNSRAPELFVMTRESTETLLQANGKTLADCIGECEIEVGRKLGADFIISGRIAQVGNYLFLTMRLFSTVDGRLLRSVDARGTNADGLVDQADATLARLVAPLEHLQTRPSETRADAGDLARAAAPTPPAAPAHAPPSSTSRQSPPPPHAAEQARKVAMPTRPTGVQPTALAGVDTGWARTSAASTASGQTATAPARSWDEELKRAARPAQPARPVVLTPSGRAYISGEIGGARFQAGDAISAVAPPSAGNAFGEVFIGSTPGICGSLAAGYSPRGLRSISIILSEKEGSEERPPSGAGTFTIGSSTKAATLTYLATDEKCRVVLSDTAESGTVELLNATSSGYRGSFDVTMKDGSQVSGSFISGDCSAIVGDPPNGCR